MGFCEKCNRQDNLTKVESEACQTCSDSTKVDGRWLCTVCVRDLKKDILDREKKDFKKSDPEFHG